jgi:hypothetical protein
MLERLGQLPSEEHDAILAAVSPAVLDEIRNAMALTWLPMEVHMGFVDTVQDVVGSTRNVRLWHDTVVEFMQRPLLESFMFPDLDIPVRVIDADARRGFARYRLDTRRLVRGAATGEQLCAEIDVIESSVRRSSLVETIPCPNPPKAGPPSSSCSSPCS